LLETTGCGVAFYDYDHDGWLDIFLVNGGAGRFSEGPGRNRICQEQSATVRLATSTVKPVWSIPVGTSVCVGDYDNDGSTTFIATSAKNCPLPHNGNGTFTDVSEKAGSWKRQALDSGCAFVDYDRERQTRPIRRQLH